MRVPQEPAMRMNTVAAPLLLPGEMALDRGQRGGAAARRGCCASLCSALGCSSSASRSDAEAVALGEQLAAALAESRRLAGDGAFDAALEVLQAAITRCPGTSTFQHGAAFLRTDCGKLLCATGRHGEGARMLKTALDIYEREGDAVGVAHVHMEVGDAMLAIEQYDSALGSYNRSAAIAGRLGDRHLDGMLDIDFRRGVALRGAGRHAEATSAFASAGRVPQQWSQAAVEQRNDVLLAELVALQNSGRQLRAQGQAEAALQLFMKALQKCPPALLQAAGSLQLDVGNTCACLGRYDAALQSHTRCLAIKRKLGDRSGEGGAHGNIGFAMKGLKRLEDALAATERSLAIMIEVGNVVGESTARRNIAEIEASIAERDR